MESNLYSKIHTQSLQITHFKGKKTSSILIEKEEINYLKISLFWQRKFCKIQSKLLKKSKRKRKIHKQENKNRKKSRKMHQ